MCHILSSIELNSPIELSLVQVLYITVVMSDCPPCIGGCVFLHCAKMHNAMKIPGNSSANVLGVGLKGRGGLCCPDTSSSATNRRRIRALAWLDFPRNFPLDN